ncbi:hypothetical protein ACH4TS_22220 [Streptomyces albidoflavus]|uniref:hypothetical protein n=1 Tax=Streptomyces sp. B29(2018) TaxID=2485016 RepID=UPI000FD65BA7|nr:hypothetical protein [Streptomyces sp. B29(2018)]
MAVSRHTPPRRTEAAARRRRTAPLSPHPEWRAQYLFVEPRYPRPLTPSVDDEAASVRADPAVVRPRRRPHRP